MPWYAYTASYFGIGFLFLVAAFIVVGPRNMWFMLLDRDPGEPSFSFIKTTSAERAERDDDHFGAWLTVFLTLFMWPAVVAVGSVMGVVWAIVWLARWISEGIVKAINPVATRSTKTEEEDAV